jgi:hypothetical protein
MVVDACKPGCASDGYVFSKRYMWVGVLREAVGASQAKVNNVNNVPTVNIPQVTNDEVRRLYVAVDDVFRMYVLDPLDYLVRKQKSGFHGELLSLECEEIV